MHRIMILTGEASGDLHGANLAKSLRELQPELELVGLGGSKMEAAGVKVVEGIRKLDIVGIPSFPQLVQAIRTYRRLVRYLGNAQLDTVVFIDNPGLNLRLAKVAKTCGLRVVYYITPQIWAWRPGRIQQIKRATDLVLVVLPFEPPIYDAADVPCRFVGNPTTDTINAEYDRAALRARFGIEPQAKLIGLFPGSREREVNALLPIMLGAAARIKPNDTKPMRFVLGRAPSIPIALIQKHLAETQVAVEIVDDQSPEVMAASDLLFVKPGTATLQAAIIGTPMIILYRTGWLTYWIGRGLIRVRWMGLPNLIAGRSIVPELLQTEFNPKRLAQEAARLLWDRQACQDMKDALADVRNALGPPGASRRAAEHILFGIGKRPPS